MKKKCIILLYASLNALCASPLYSATSFGTYHAPPPAENPTISITGLHGKGTGTYNEEAQTATICTNYTNVTPMPSTSLTNTTDGIFAKSGYYPFGSSSGFIYYGVPTNQKTITGPAKMIKDQYGYGSANYDSATKTATVCSAYTNVKSISTNISQQIQNSYTKEGYFPFGTSPDGKTTYYGKPKTTFKKKEKRY